jgi:hypothetical protein
VKEKRHAENSGNNSAIKRKPPETIAPYCFKPGQSGNPIYANRIYTSIVIIPVVVIKR